MRGVELGNVERRLEGREGKRGEAMRASKGWQEENKGKLKVGEKDELDVKG